MACIYQDPHGIRADRLRKFLRDVPDDAVICLETPSEWDVIAADTIETTAAGRDGDYWCLVGTPGVNEIRDVIIIRREGEAA